MKLTIFHRTFSHRSECRNYKRILQGILSVPRNTVMGMNNVMGNSMSCVMVDNLVTICSCNQNWKLSTRSD